MAEIECSHDSDTLGTDNSTFSFDFSELFIELISGSLEAVLFTGWACNPLFLFKNKNAERVLIIHVLACFARFFIMQIP